MSVFPRSIVVRTMKAQLGSMHQLSQPVKDAANQWLATMLERVSKRLAQEPYTTIDIGMFKEAIKPYENIDSIEKEKERIIAQLMSIREQCNILIDEIDAKFRKP